MTTVVLRETADIVAASLCWLARWSSTVPGPVGGHVTTRHPGKCAFCKRKPDELLASIETFHVIDGADRVASADFVRLPIEDQRALVDAAMYPKGRPAGPAPVEKSLSSSIPPRDYVPGDLAPYGAPNPELVEPKPGDELAEAFA